MKKKNNFIASICFMLLLTLGGLVQAQQSETFTIPLSRPGEPGKLKVHLIEGSITVSGYDGKDVKVTAVGRTAKKVKQRSKDGMKAVGSNQLTFSVEERDNNVYVKKMPGGSSRVQFEIQVPRNFSVDLKTINGKAILVDNVDGTHEASNTNGKISMTNVGGSVVADALNENITVSFRRITSNTTMAFTSLNGDVDITFPNDLKANIRAKSEFGNVYTDFEIAIDRTQSKSESTKKNGVYKVVNKKGVYGSINGGGSEITFKTLNGDIMIRSH